METIVFPVVETAVIGRLSELLDVPVSGNVPTSLPDRWVRVMRTGGPRRGLVLDEAQITLEAWAVRAPDAAELAQQVRAHIYAMRGQTVGGVLVVRVTPLGGPAFDPDPNSRHHRYAWSEQIVVRGTAAPYGVPSGGGYWADLADTWAGLGGTWPGVFPDGVHMSSEKP